MKIIRKAFVVAFGLGRSRRFCGICVLYMWCWLGGEVCLKGCLTADVFIHSFTDATVVWSSELNLLPSKYHHIISQIGWKFRSVWNEIMFAVMTVCCSDSSFGSDNLFSSDSLCLHPKPCSEVICGYHNVQSFHLEIKTWPTSIWHTRMRLMLMCCMQFFVD